MKKLILSGILGFLLLPGLALAYTLPASYRAVYCYPTGTYWQAQISAYPDYYAAHNAHFESKYGAATIYCPA